MWTRHIPTSFLFVSLHCYRAQLLNVIAQRWQLAIFSGHINHLNGVLIIIFLSYFFSSLSFLLLILSFCESPAIPVLMKAIPLSISNYFFVWFLLSSPVPVLQQELLSNSSANALLIWMVSSSCFGSLCQVAKQHAYQNCFFFLLLLFGEVNFCCIATILNILSWHNSLHFKIQGNVAQGSEGVKQINPAVVQR